MNGTPDATLNEILDHFPDFELYKHEAFFGGSADAERAEFHTHITKVQNVQQSLAHKSAAHRPSRIFHAKSHGALLGELRLKPGRPAEVRRGVFGDGAPPCYPVLARFSNGKGTIHADFLPDVRGVALKIFNVSQEPEQTMDLLMTNSPVAFGKDHAEFVEFMVAVLNPLTQAAFFATHPRAAKALLRAAGVPPLGGMTTVTFGSGHAYLLGPDNAMKMKLTPSINEETIHQRAAEIWHLVEDPNYLAADLKARAHEQISFTLSIQLESKNPEQTPIEDALAEWKEEVSPFIEVADLVFPRQPMTDVSKQIAEELAFTPWNYVPEHRPLGNLARGRLFSYLASALNRGAKRNPSFAALKAEWGLNAATCEATSGM
jgi:catalase